MNDRQPFDTRLATRLSRRAARASRRLRMAGEGVAFALDKVGIGPIALFDRVSALAGDRRTVRIGSFAYGDLPRQRLDLWGPQDPPARPLPTIIFFYGGGWTKGERGEFGFVARALAAEGYLVAMPDYRHAPEGKFPHFVEDGAKALRWCVDHVADHGGDPSRIALGGHSAGGHLAALLMLDDRYQQQVGLPQGTVKAGVLLSAPTNFLPLSDERAVLALGDWPRPEETQPIAFARRDAPPLLLASGSADIIVRARNSQQLHRAIVAAEGEATLRLYPGQTHSDTIKSFSPLFRGNNPALADTVAFLRGALALRD